MRLSNLFRFSKRTGKSITVVSGLPRSGTSMMMQILHAGGLEPVTDNVRLADASNSKGYYEHEAVKALSKGNYECLRNAQGRAIKIISSLLKHLPCDHHYKVIFMQRDIDDVIESQDRMLLSLNKPLNSQDNKKIKKLYAQHLNNITSWLSQQDNIDVLYVNYTEVLNKPVNHIDLITEFTHIKADSKPMIDCIDKHMCHNENTETTVV